MSAEEGLTIGGVIGLIVVAIILFVFIPGVIIAIVVPTSIHRRKYTNFVDKYSDAFNKIKVINARYKFASIPNFDMSHTYDNNDFYPTVSCQDYLIYQLVYLDKKVTKALNDIEDNKFKYSMYSKEISGCYYGQFNGDTTDYNLETLKKYEKKMVKANIKIPTMHLYITVTLRREDIGGNYKERKSKTFKESEINSLLSRIHNKRGARYLDDGIWQSIVKVERAKVSNKMRFAVFQRDHERCVKCGSRRNLEVDHIYPISKGGKTEMSNLQTLCHRCNVKKGNSIE